MCIRDRPHSGRRQPLVHKGTTLDTGTDIIGGHSSPKLLPLLHLHVPSCQFSCHSSPKPLPVLLYLRYTSSQVTVLHLHCVPSCKFPTNFNFHLSFERLTTRQNLRFTSGLSTRRARSPQSPRNVTSRILPQFRASDAHDQSPQRVAFRERWPGHPAA